MLLRGHKKTARSSYGSGGSRKKPRQRPTFALSTIIGPGRLNGRVRNGNGCVPAGMVTWEKFRVVRRAIVDTPVHVALGNFIITEHTSTNDHDIGSISNGQLKAFRYTPVHLRPINLVVFQGAHRQNSSRGGLHA